MYIVFCLLFRLHCDILVRDIFGSRSVSWLSSQTIKGRHGITTEQPCNNWKTQPYLTQRSLADIISIFIVHSFSYLLQQPCTSVRLKPRFSGVATCWVGPSNCGLSTETSLANDIHEFKFINKNHLTLLQLNGLPSQWTTSTVLNQRCTLRGMAYLVH